MMVGIHNDLQGYRSFDIDYSAEPYGDSLAAIAEAIEHADLLIGFNIKFDLHWIRRYIPNVKFPRVFDCQLAEFILGHQREPYPSLGQVCIRRGLGSKLDVVEREYWSNGIDTPDIPRDVLETYLKADVMLTRACFESQRRELSGKLKVLFVKQCEDLLALEEAEWNGMLYDKEEAKKKSEEVKLALVGINRQLVQLAGGDETINFDSSDDVSCVLYGGTRWVLGREKYYRELKNGTVKEHERNVLVERKCTRLVSPIKGTENKPSKGWSDDTLARRNAERESQGRRPIERHWSVSEPILKSLKARGKAKKIIELLLEKAKLDKLDSTYYSGLVKKYEEMEWDDDRLHGQFNQCVARTGRLSSSNPNLQNFSDDIKHMFYSEFA